MFAEESTPIDTEKDRDAFLIENAQASSPMLLVCDHASTALPEQFNNLGLSPDILSQHVGWDIGALEVARRLVARFDSTLVSSVYSRLLVDLNRFPDHASWIPEISDGIEIPANKQLGDSARKQRADNYFWPYQNAVGAAIGKIVSRGQVPVMVSVHSFTPCLNSGEKRPWHFGILWGDDDRLANPLITALRKNTALCVGDNQPYHANKPSGYTSKTHAENAGYPHVLIEIRQDLIDSEAGIVEWADILGDALESVFDDCGYFQDTAAVE